MKSICPMAGSLRDFVSLKLWEAGTKNPLDENSENLKNAIDSTLNGACIAALGASKFWRASSSYGSEELICLLPWGWKGLATRVLGRSWKLIVFEVDVLHGQGLDVEDQHHKQPSFRNSVCSYCHLQSAHFGSTTVPFWYGRVVVTCVFCSNIVVWWSPLWRNITTKNFHLQQGFLQSLPTLSKF